MIEEKKDCTKCDDYGECDHQGAYKINGRWCWEEPLTLLDKLIEIRTDLTIKDAFIVEVDEALDFEDLDSSFIKGFRHGMMHASLEINELIQKEEAKQ
jgi:hypothetical protein